MNIWSALIFEYAFELLDAAQWAKTVDAPTNSLVNAFAANLRERIFLVDSQRVAHNDVKPANIVVNVTAQPTLKIVDFEHAVYTVDSSESIDRALAIPCHYAPSVVHSSAYGNGTHAFNGHALQMGSAAGHVINIGAGSLLVQTPAARVALRDRTHIGCARSFQERFYKT